MTNNQPSRNQAERTAHVAVVMLDTRVGGSHVPREKYRKAGVPIPPTAKRIAARLSEAVGETITGDEVRAAAALLCSNLPTHQLRALAEPEAPYDEHDAARLEADHGAWLDKRIDGELAVLVGIDLDLYSGPLRLNPERDRVVPAGESVRCLRRGSAGSMYVHVEHGGSDGYVRRTQLLDAIAATAGDVAAAERAAGWDASA